MTIKIDAVAMKWEAAAAIYEEIKDLTPEQRVAYWEKATRELVARQRQLRAEAGLPNEERSAAS